MAVIDRMLERLDSDVAVMQEGLQPRWIAPWYEKVVSDARASAPAHLRDLISARQDPVLPMKFRLDVSRRAVRYLEGAIEESIPRMPYTTGVYFMRVLEQLRASG